MRGKSPLRGSAYLYGSGFTLVELVISIVLIGMLAAVGSSMIADSFTTTRMVNADTASVGQARYALERLAREIREVKYASSKASPATYCSVGVTNQYCISAPTPLPTTLTILPGGGGLSFAFVNAGDATVTINGAGTSLTLNGSQLGANVTSLSFDFSAIDGTTPPTTSTIRFVVIKLTVADPASGQPIVQRTRVALREG